MYCGDLWEAMTFIERVVIAFLCHLLHSLGGSLPLVCHLEPSIQSVLSFIQALPHITLLCFSFLLHLSPPQGDRGGRLTLQKRWTSFLKARLTCSLPEYDFHFNMLRSVFAMPGHTPQDTLFYGIFGLEWWVSAVKISGWQGLWGCKCKWARQRWKAAIDTLSQWKKTGREEMKAKDETKQGELFLYKWCESWMEFCSSLKSAF